MSTDSFIGVSAPEIDRLRAQHEAWRIETETLWKDADFGSLQSIVDLGCSPGFTRLDLARLLGSSGAGIGERSMRTLVQESGFIPEMAQGSEFDRLDASVELPIPNIDVGIRGPTQ